MIVTCCKLVWYQQPVILVMSVTYYLDRFYSFTNTVLWNVGNY
jgi:hypothetical protein